MSVWQHMLDEYLGGLDIPEKTGLPAGTYTKAGDIEGLQSIIGARQAVPPGVLSAPQLPPQLQRRQPNFPEPTMQGPMSKLAFQMAGPTGQAPPLQQPIPGMRIPTPPMNPQGAMSQQLPMIDPMNILRMLQTQGIY